MTGRPPAYGDVFMAQLGTLSPSGHEQEGPRPVVVVGLPGRAGPGRYPVLVCAPLSSQVGAWPTHALYPRLAAGEGGLPVESVVLVDHLRGLDTSRIRRHLGTLNTAQYQPIRSALRLVFDF